MKNERPFSPFFGKFLREKREKKEISLRKLATEIGLSGARLCEVERGNDRPPCPESNALFYSALAKILDVHSHQLKKRAVHSRGVFLLFDGDSDEEIDLANLLKKMGTINGEQAQAILKVLK